MITHATRPRLLSAIICVVQVMPAAEFYIYPSKCQDDDHFNLFLTAPLVSSLNASDAIRLLLLD